MITDLEARKISCSWHGGQGSALYALCSTGAIDNAKSDHDIMAELFSLRAEPAQPLTKQNIRDLDGLIDYVYEYQPRGPVAGWGELTW